MKRLMMFIRLSRISSEITQNGSGDLKLVQRLFQKPVKLIQAHIVVKMCREFGIPVVMRKEQCSHALVLHEISGGGIEIAPPMCIHP